MYRESEAQTNPYTPAYKVVGDTDPELLLLKDLTFENGQLPVSKNSVDMIECAREKQYVEINLPPFTDEASLIFRKRLMEEQEMREFKLRESEIDRKRHERLATLQQALADRDESHEFLASQRVENTRMIRMEEREKELQKIRLKRIKVLRQVAHARNNFNPILSDGIQRDIIGEYFNRASDVYAPIKREGREVALPAERFDVASRVAPLSSLANISSLEQSIPSRLLGVSEVNGSVMMSKTAPAAFAAKPIIAAEDRLSSAARRALRDTKRDLEEMQQILLKKKRDKQAQSQASRGASRHATPATTSSSPLRTSSAGLGSPKSRQGKSGKAGRPSTPNLTVDQDGNPLQDNQELTAACVLLQKLIRGRAVQNIMYEGRYRKRELIRELRADDEFVEVPKTVTEINTAFQKERMQRIQTATVDAIAGGVVSHQLLHMSQEQERIDTFQRMQEEALQAIEHRRRLEAAEAGRRQRENMEYPCDPPQEN